MLFGEASNDKSLCRFILHPIDLEEEWNDARSQVRIVFELLNVGFMLCPSPYSHLNKTQKCKNSHCRNMKDSALSGRCSKIYIQYIKTYIMVRDHWWWYNIMQNIKCNSFILHQRILLCFLNFKTSPHFFFNTSHIS